MKGKAQYSCTVATAIRYESKILIKLTAGVIVKKYFIWVTNKLERFRLANLSSLV